MRIGKSVLGNEKIQLQTVREKPQIMHAISELSLQGGTTKLLSQNSISSTAGHTWVMASSTWFIFALGIEHFTLECVYLTICNTNEVRKVQKKV